MRVIVAVTAGITTLLLGLVAISTQADEVEPGDGAGDSVQNSYDTALGVFDGVFQAGEGIVWFGVAAIILVACGLLLAASSGGR